MNKIIEKIAKMRDARGWTNYRLYIETGVSAGTISNWYKSNAIPKFSAIQQICEAFGISLCEFFNYDDERISLSENQKEFLNEYDQLNKDEKAALLNLIATMNATRKKFN